MPQQAGGAARVGEENRIAASQSPCQAENASDVMTRFGNYLGSWIGLSPVPEDEGESAHSDLHLTSAALQNQICGNCDAYILDKCQRMLPGQLTWTKGCCAGTSILLRYNVYKLRSQDLQSMQHTACNQQMDLAKIDAPMDTLVRASAKSAKALKCFSPMWLINTALSLKVLRSKARRVMAHCSQHASSCCCRRQTPEDIVVKRQGSAKMFAMLQAAAGKDHNDVDMDGRKKLYALYISCC